VTRRAEYCQARARTSLEDSLGLEWRALDWSISSISHTCVIAHGPWTVFQPIAKSLNGGVQRKKEKKRPLPLSNWREGGHSDKHTAGTMGTAESVNRRFHPWGQCPSVVSLNKMKAELKKIAPRRTECTESLAPGCQTIHSNFCVSRKDSLLSGPVFVVIWRIAALGKNIAKCRFSLRIKKCAQDWDVPKQFGWTTRKHRGP